MDVIPTVTEFKRRFPEMANAPFDLCTQVLTDAAAETRDRSYPRYDVAVQACLMKAAVLLLESPYGQKMRLEAPEQMLAYEFRLGRKQRSAMMGLRVF